MRRSIYLLSLLFVATAQCGAATTLELKGLQPGLTKTEINERMPALKCAPEQPIKAISTCDYTRRSIHQDNVTELNTLAEGLVETWIFEFMSDKLGAILVLFPNENWDKTIAALIIKFGAPSNTTTQRLQNRLGATFNSRVLVWRQGGVTLIASEHASDLKTSSLSLGADTHLKSRQTKDKEESSRRAKDL